MPTGGLGRVLDTVTPRPVVAAVARCPTHRLDGARATATSHVVLVGVADPGNVGTLLRTAEAAGAGAVVVLRRTADPFGPKVVRASAGSVLRVPVVARPGRRRGARRPRRGGRPAARASAADGAAAYDAVDLTGPVALVLGSEAHGLPAATSPGRIDRLVVDPDGGARRVAERRRWPARSWASRSPGNGGRRR